MTDVKGYCTFITELCRKLNNFDCIWIIPVGALAVHQSLIYSLTPALIELTEEVIARARCY